MEPVWKGPPSFPERKAAWAFSNVNTSEPVSRVLFSTAIYLGAPLPVRSSHLPGETGPVTFPSTVLLRIEFTSPDTSEPAGELLPHLSTLTWQSQAVSLCCTCPEVAFGGRYPLSLPYGARTFLMKAPFGEFTRLSVPVTDILYFIFLPLSNRLQNFFLSAIIPNLTVNRSSKARKPLGHKGLRVFGNVSRM